MSARDDYPELVGVKLAEYWVPRNVVSRALDEIDRLRAEVERLRSALLQLTSPKPDGKGYRP